MTPLSTQQVASPALVHSSDEIPTETPSTAIPTIALTVISYNDLENGNPESLLRLKAALKIDGIIGVSTIPEYSAKVTSFVEAIRLFSAKPEETKQLVAADDGKIFGYELGKEQFFRNNQWIVDDSKHSYYALVPDTSENKWPDHTDLKTPFQAIATLMSDVGSMMMDRMGLLNSTTLADHSMGRMLHYSKSSDSETNNPYWCGDHYDHGLFTGLLPAYYFRGLNEVEEPAESGIFVRPHASSTFKKVVADKSVLLFQVGEFAQLCTNDAIHATEHRVVKAGGDIERFTLALFFSPPLDAAITSTSTLATDLRYGENTQCSFWQWHTASLNRYRA